MNSLNSSNPLLTSFKQLGSKVAIFGGTFDPVQNAHISLARTSQTDFELDSVIFIPAKRNPLKAKSALASDQDRIEMLTLALRAEQRMFVTDIELKRQGDQSFTVDTLRQLRVELAPELKELFVLFGSDQLKHFHEWKDYKAVLELANPIVVGRSGFVLPHMETINSNLSKAEISQLSENFLEFDSQISASEIRERIAAGDLEKARADLPAAVYDYICDHKLYTAAS